MPHSSLKAGGIFLKAKPSTSITPPRFFQTHSSSLKEYDLITKEFLKLHSQYAESQSLEDIDSIITYLNGKLSLWHKPVDKNFIEIQMTATPALEEEYKLIKSISHLSVSFVLVLQNIIENRKKTITHTNDLQLIKNQLQRLNHIITKNELALIIINTTRHAIEKIEQTQCVDKIQCTQTLYLLETTKTLEHLAYQAVQLQLNGINKIIPAWIKTHPLQKTRVLIACTKGPKEDLIEKQYFQWLYQQIGIENPEQKNYIFCIEMLPEQLTTIESSCLISFLKNHQLNSQIGKIMLGDPQAMNKDVLGKYASDILPNLCPIQKATNNTLHLHSSALSSSHEKKLQKNENTPTEWLKFHA